VTQLTVVILGELEFHSADVAIAAAAAAKHAAATQREPGCRHFAFARDVQTPEILRISEWWENEECLRAHLEQEHVLEFTALIRTLRMKSVSGTQYLVSQYGPAPA
jgi:quinol monooxygenase YgiN